MQPTGQIVRVCEPALVEMIAKALSQLGTRKALVVRGREKLDEAGLASQTSATAKMRGGDIEENAQILKNVLQGKGTRTQQDVVTLNTALALQVGGVTEPGDYRQGIAITNDILSNGSA